MSNLALQVKHLPLKPGVYLFKDARGTIIYVGKASRLHDRVRSYFGSKTGMDPKTQLLVEDIRDLEFFVTNSEQEALVLEQNLVKRYRPHYNIRLKDDKSFPFLKIDLKEEWPRIYMTRHVVQDGSRYFGPFTSPWSVRETLKVLKKIFRFRTCPKPAFDAASRACLEYHIGQCAAPCTGNIAKDEYDKIIKQVALFLEGRQNTILTQLKAKMEKASDVLDFERAAVLRDQIAAIERVIEGQKIAFPVAGEEDVVAFATERDIAAVQVFLIREARVIGRETFTMQGVSSAGPSEIMTSFVKQYYGSAVHIPPHIKLQHSVEDRENIEAWLGGRRGSTVHIDVPVRGKQKQLVDMVAANARHGLEQLKLKQPQTPADLAAALEEIKAELSLPRLPERMECYDISNIQGKMAVGSMVVFEDGKPKTSDYRRFKIKTVPGADDYSMLAEVLKRRFKRVNLPQPSVDEQNQENTVPFSDSFKNRPDLVLIDGGKGQLNAALEALKEISAGNVSVASLAKEHEEVFLPRRAEPLALPPNSRGLQMLQRLRDEAHRFAVTYHRGIRRKQSFASALDSIPGIGSKRKRALLRKFGSLKGIKQAGIAELASVENISPALAAKLKETL